MQHETQENCRQTIAGQPSDVIDEAVIERLIRRFYDNVRDDKLLGPIFDARIADWETHLQRMFAFWSSVMLGSGRYQGQPMQKHDRLPIDARHFDHWLSIFERTARDACSPVVAELFIERAQRIATSLEMGRAIASDVLLAKGQRFIDAALNVPSAPLR